MKKLLAILTALLPVIYVITMQIVSQVQMGDDGFFAVLGIYLLIGLMFPILFSIASTKACKRFLAISNVWIYCANLALMIAEIVFWLIRFEENRIAEQNGAMEGGLGLVLLILFVYMPHWLSYLISRIVGAIHCERTLKGICGGGARALLTLFQLLPVTDLLSALWVYRKVRNT